MITAVAPKAKGRPKMPLAKGRPKMPLEERKGINLTFRARKDLRDRLGIAAAVNQRSISEEVEHRIELTFTHQDVAIRLLGAKVQNR